jgi:hypothetical protein
VATLPVTPSVHAQHTTPGGGDAVLASPIPREAAYVVDNTNEWRAEFGVEEGAGDWRYYRNPLYNVGETRQAGWADGYCVQSAPSEWAYCTWSLYTNRWTLSAHGVLDELSGENWFVIAGGTGAYADVHGRLLWMTDEAGEQSFFAVEEQEYAAYDPLRVTIPEAKWQTTHWFDPATSYANVLYWHDPLYNEAQTEQIGWSNGFCIWTAPNKAAECTWTNWGEGWALSASGVKYDEGVSLLSIIGGTGSYAGATGTVRTPSPTILNICPPLSIALLNSTLVGAAFTPTCLPIGRGQTQLLPVTLAIGTRPCSTPQRQARLGGAMAIVS